MPLPQYQLNLDPPCCTWAFDLANQVLQAANTAVAACIAPYDCGQLDAYVSTGTTTVDPASDYLTISWITTIPSTRSRDERGQHQLALARARFRLELLETGWPVPQEDGGMFQPVPAEEYQFASLHSWAHAQAMYNAVVNILTDGTLNPYLDGCYVQFDALQPIQPNGASVGWSLEFQVNYRARNVVLGS